MVEGGAGFFMRTLILILFGLVAAIVVLRLSPQPRRRIAASVFSVGWLGAVAWNLRTGLSHGYSLSEELPIQAAIFLVPVAVAWWMALRRRSVR